MGVEAAFFVMLENLARRLDLVFVFTMFVVSLFKGWIVLGYHYSEKVNACDKWERLALRGTTLAETAVSTLAAAQPKV